MAASQLCAVATPIGMSVIMAAMPTPSYRDNQCHNDCARSSPAWLG